MDGEQLQKLGVERNLGISGVAVNAVEKIVLFVVVGCEDDKVDNALEDLAPSAYVRVDFRKNTYGVKLSRVFFYRLCV